MNKTTTLITALALGLSTAPALAANEFTSPDCSIETIDRADNPCAFRYDLMYKKYPDNEIFNYREGKDWIYHGDTIVGSGRRIAHLVYYTFFPVPPEMREQTLLTSCDGYVAMTERAGKTLEQVVDDLAKTRHQIEFGINMIDEQVYLKVCSDELSREHPGPKPGRMR
jgi:hypothetical protein